MRFVLDQARERSCGRIEWQVLNWNEPAVRFYEKVGAERMDEWSTYRLSAEQFESIEPRLTME
jgi:RimJ/RimL family protein N-acetyltransferase